MQTQFAVALVGMAITNVDAHTIDLDGADQYGTRTYLIGIEVGVGLHAIERLQRHAIGVTRPDQEVTKVPGVMRVGQVGTRRCADIADKWAKSRKHAGNS